MLPIHDKMYNDHGTEHKFSHFIPPFRYQSDYIEDGEEFLDRSESHPWSIIWSDLVFILLVILFAYAATLYENKNKKISSSPVKENKPVQQNIIHYEYKKRYSEQDQLFEITRDITREFEEVSVSLQEDNSVKVSIEGPLLFDIGKSEINSSAIEFLHKISDIIRKTDYKIHVVGHTDDIPIHTSSIESNWELSLMRAAKVTRYLIEKMNLEPGRFAIIGYSMFQPVAPNTTAEQRALNRRVEIIITRDSYKT